MTYRIADIPMTLSGPITGLLKCDFSSVTGSILKYMYFKEYFKYMLSILQCILDTFVVFVI